MAFADGKRRPFGYPLVLLTSNELFTSVLKLCQPYPFCIKQLLPTVPRQLLKNQHDHAFRAGGNGHSYHVKVHSYDLLRLGPFVDSHQPSSTVHTVYRHGLPVRGEHWSNADRWLKVGFVDKKAV